MQYKNTTTGDIITLSDNQANTFQGGQGGLAKSGYLPYTPATTNLNNPADTKVNAVNTVNPTASDGGNGLVQSYQPGTISGSLAQNDLANLQSAITNAKNQSIITNARNQINQGEDTLQAYDLASIERQKQAAQLRKSQQLADNQEELATSKAGQFKLGQAGTTYADEATRKIKETQNRQIQLMDLQLQDLVEQAQKYMVQGDVRKASQTLQTAKDFQDQQYQMRQEQRQQEAADLNRVLQLSQEQRSRTTFNRTEQEAKVKNLVPTLFNNLTNNPEENLALISQFSQDYGVDPNYLMSAVISEKTTREKDALVNSSSLANILKSTKTGGAISVPGLGKVEIIGEEDQAPTTLKAGGSVYQYQNGQWVNTGIKDTELNPATIISALQSLGNVNVLQNYLVDQGVNIPQSGSVSFRHNNPLNIKFGSFASQYGATAGQAAKDGGQFAQFPTVEAGLKAAKELLRSPSYANLPLEQAMRKWSGNGYGTDVLQTDKNLANKTTGQMTDKELNTLIDDMKQREGWVEGNEGNEGAKEIARNIFSGQSSIDVKSLPTNQRAAVDKELTNLKKTALDSGDFIGVMRASAGGGDVGDTFLQSFDKGLNVIQQINDLQNTIQKESTGPILGILRSKNPYDTKAQLIKSQLAAIVPNLARGVYGEVGVLTDNDINNYSKTLPNLTSTEDVRDAVLALTVRSVQRSLENKLRTQAAGKKDVSGFIDTYSGIKTLADSLSKKVGINEDGSTNIKVRLKATGQTGTIPPGEFNEALYEKI